MSEDQDLNAAAPSAGVPVNEHKPAEHVKPKGKGQAFEDDSSDEEGNESEGEDNTGIEMDEDDADEDDLAEIDTNNIVTSGRTRGKNIDFAKAAKELDAEGTAKDDDDEEEDDDFVDPDSKMTE